MNFEAYKKQAFKDDPELKSAYDALEPEYQIMKATFEARQKSNLSQKELAQKMGTSQANISKLENGELNPSIGFLDRLAKACDMHLVVGIE